MRHNSLCIVIFYITTILLHGHPCFASSTATTVLHTETIAHGGYLLAENDKIIEAYNSKKSFIPASTIKIITAFAALEELGADYRFITSFYTDKQNNLYIIGGADPFLTSENVEKIIIHLISQGLTEVNNLILDDSLFQLPTNTAWNENSHNPYDAQNSALAVNFNSIPIRVMRDKTVLSDEKQTPTIGIMKDGGFNLAPGHHRINVNHLEQKSSLNNTLRYSGELFQVFLQKYGIEMQGTIQSGTRSHNSTLLFQYSSDQPLSTLLRLCLKYSNNFVANQVFLTMGMKKYGPPATWDKGRKAMKSWMDTRFEFGHQPPVITEGSGLSRKNSITPEQMLQILLKFRQYGAELLPIKENSYIKSGTLQDVFCYAGYIPYNSRLYPVVIFLNQPENLRNQLLTHLQSLLHTAGEQTSGNQ